jgi:hypothetical protein
VILADTDPSRSTYRISRPFSFAQNLQLILGGGGVITVLKNSIKKWPKNLEKMAKNNFIG